VSNTTHASTSSVLPQNASHYPYTNDPKMLQKFTPLPEQLVPPTLHFTTLTISRSYAMSPSTPTSSKKKHYLHRAINNFGSCYGILYDFSHGFGFGKPHLTCIFSANRESSYFSIEHVQSRIIEVNEYEINLRPTHFTHPTIAHSLRSPLPSYPPPPPAVVVVEELHRPTTEHPNNHSTEVPLSSE
jgi:hypothetical protein